MKFSNRTARIVGAYAAQPANLTERRAYLEAVLALSDIDGLEIPWGAPSWRDDALILQKLFRSQTRGGRHVLTLIAAQANAVAQNSAFGLASRDEDGRRAAIDLVRSAHDDLARFAQDGQEILAVEIHSYPSVPQEGVVAAAEALQHSLAEILDWDWGGTTLILEHCDTRTPTYPWQKGLLPLDVEIDAVTMAAKGGRPVSMAVNWGRSALEERDALAPERHVRRLKEAGLLRGIIFSGAASEDSPYGPAWADTHPPLKEQLPQSAMTRAHVAAIMEIAGEGLLYEGMKIGIRPPEATVSQRLDLVEKTLAALPGRAA